MNEIEVKVLEINKNEVIKKLIELKAVLVKKEFQANYMFDYKNQTFENKGGYVRIRKAYDFINNKEKITLTSKELISKDKFKISKEIEFQAYEFENTKLFLESLGLVQFRLDEKYRESYKLDEGLVEIDTWAGVKTYLEVEAETELEIEIILNKLGYDLKDSTSMTLKEIMKKYHIPEKDMIFTEKEKKEFFK
ncbi:MAG: class IV adenylate cyclase [Candidatus Sericytochromatia bacterium]